MDRRTQKDNGVMEVFGLERAAESDIDMSSRVCLTFGVVCFDGKGGRRAYVIFGIGLVALFFDLVR